MKKEEQLKRNENLQGNSVNKKAKQDDNASIIEHTNHENEATNASLEALNQLYKENISKFKSEQNLTKGIIAGIAAGVLGAVLWGVITVMTGYQIAYMAIAVGVLVGFSIRFLGKGIDPIFGISGAVIALLSCLLGNFFSIIGFISNSEGMGYIDVLTMFDYSQLIPLLTETFNFIDLLFYGIAAYVGYSYSFREITAEDLNHLNT